MSLHDTSQRSGSAQAGRWFDLQTPLGKDVLLVTEVVGEEGISRLYHFEIVVVSEQQSIAAGDLLGKGVTLGLGCLTTDNPARRVNGIVTRFRGGRVLRNGLHEFRLEVSPTLWVLQRNSRYKVYQQKSPKDIILQLLGDANVAYTNHLTKTYDSREYCVQYGETDFEFFTRLAAEVGIFYYFTHADGSHNLVLEDSATWSSADPKDLAYNPGDTNLYDTVNAIEFGPGLIDKTYRATDYDFETPDTSINKTTNTQKKPSDSMSWEQHIHAVGLPTQSSAQRAAEIDIASGEGDYETGVGRGTYPGFVPGFVFMLPDHGDSTLAQSKLVATTVRHDGIEPAWALQTSQDAKRPPYRNTFECVPQKVPLPSMVPPQKPLARGPTTALVVGPSGSEIHTDKYGRIRVQFYWDLIGTKDEKSSCFIRVAQPWAGKNWGAVFIPRVGMEVVVHFLDGDPDRPLVTGTVYNGTNATPWTLPDKMTKSGILTRSTKSGGTADANELSFDDDIGNEVFLIHAQRDHKREVENDETITVGHDQTSEVTNDRTTTVKQGNDVLTVQTGNRTQTIQTGNDTLEVDTGNRAVTIKTGNHDLTLNLGNASTLCSVGKIALEAAQSVKLTCGMNTLELTPSGITLNGIEISVQATAMLEEKAPMITVKADAMAQIEGGIVQIN